MGYVGCGLDMPGLAWRWDPCGGMWNRCRKGPVVRRTRESPKWLGTTDVTGISCHSPSCWWRMQLDQEKPCQKEPPETSAKRAQPLQDLGWDAGGSVSRGVIGNHKPPSFFLKKNSLQGWSRSQGRWFEQGAKYRGEMVSVPQRVTDGQLNSE